MRLIIQRTGWGIMMALSIILFSTTIAYFSFRSDYFFLNEKQDVVFNTFWRTAFYIHITGGMLALVIGPIQFLRNFRNKYLKLHRLLGKIYLVSILILGGPAGLFMGFYAEGGWLGSMGFIAMAILWLVATFMAYEKIRGGNVAAHRKWMIRSYALTFAAVTLRLWVPFASHILFLEMETIVISSAWISWMPNLFVAEIINRFVSEKYI